jgi:hypothetical protein
MRADIVATPSFTLPGLRDRIYDLILARISDPWIIVASARAQWARERKIDLFLHQTTTPAGKMMFHRSAAISTSAGSRSRRRPSLDAEVMP